MEQNSENKTSTSMVDNHSDDTIKGLRHLVALDSISSDKESLIKIVKDSGHSFDELDQTQNMQIVSNRIAKQLEEKDADEFDKYVNNLTDGRYANDFENASNALKKDPNSLASLYNFDPDEINASGGLQNVKGLLNSLSEEELKEVGSFAMKLAAKAAVAGLVGAMSGAAGPVFITLALKQGISHVAFKELAATGITDAVAIRVSENISKFSAKIKEPSLDGSQNNIKKVALLGAVSALALVTGASIASMSDGNVIDVNVLKSGIDSGAEDFVAPKEGAAYVAPTNILNENNLENAHNSVDVTHNADGSTTYRNYDKGDSAWDVTVEEAKYIRDYNALGSDAQIALGEKYGDIRGVKFAVVDANSFGWAKDELGAIAPTDEDYQAAAAKAAGYALLSDIAAEGGDVSQLQADEGFLNYLKEMILDASAAEDTDMSRSTLVVPANLSEEDVKSLHSQYMKDQAPTLSDNPTDKQTASPEAPEAPEDPEEPEVPKTNAELAEQARDQAQFARDFLDDWEGAERLEQEAAKYDKLAKEDALKETVGVLKTDTTGVDPLTVSPSGFTDDLMKGVGQKLAENIPSVDVENSGDEVTLKTATNPQATTPPKTNLDDTIGVMAPSGEPKDAPSFSESVLNGAKEKMEKDLPSFVEPKTPDITVPERPESPEVASESVSSDNADANEVVESVESPEFEEVVIESGDSLWKLLDEQLDKNGIEFENEDKKNAAIVEIINKHYGGMENVHMVKLGDKLNVISYSSVEQLRNDLEGVDLSNNVLAKHEELGSRIVNDADKTPAVSKDPVENNNDPSVEMVGDKQTSQPKNNVDEIEDDINAFEDNSKNVAQNVAEAPSNSKNVAQNVAEAPSVAAPNDLQHSNSNPLSQFGVGKAWDQLGVGELAQEKVVVNHQTGQLSFYTRQQDFAELISKSGLELSEAEQDWLARGFEAKLAEYEKINGAADKGFSYVANVSKASIEELLTDYPIGYGSEYAARVAAMSADVVIKFDPETADLIAPKGVLMTASQFAAQIIANKVQSGEIDPLSGEISNKITEIAYKLKLANPEGTQFNSINLPQELVKQSTHGIDEVGVFASTPENDDDELNSFADKVTKVITPMSADATAFTSNIEYLNKLNDMPSVDSSPIFYEVIENVVHSGGTPISLNDYTDAIVKAQIEGKLIDVTQINLIEHKANMLELLQKSNPNIGEGDLVTQIEVPAILSGEKNLPIRDMGVFDNRVSYSHVKAEGMTESASNTPTNKPPRKKMDF